MAKVLVVDDEKPIIDILVYNLQKEGYQTLEATDGEMGLNLAIEYNGCYFHSIYVGKSKDYHLMKSLLCREKGIRLIHIYEFEDLDKQIELLKQLILGEDKYPKNDFNKNNLLKNIPKPEIIFNDGRLIIYGAGKLY